MQMEVAAGHFAKHWPKWLIGAAVAVHFGMMGSLFWGYFDAFFNNSDVERQALDFFSIYEAGHRGLLNDSVYGGTHEPAVPYFTFYRYVPFFAYAFAVPANTLPAWGAYWVWVAFYEVLLALMAYATWRLAGRGTWAYVAATMWFVYTPFYQEQYLGQFSFLMGVALFWIGVALARQREGLATVPWAVSLVTKSSSVLLGPLFVRMGWGRVLIAGVVLILINLPCFLWRPDDWHTFYAINFDSIFSATDRFLAFIPGDLGGPAVVRNAFFLIDTDARQVPGAYTVALAALIVLPSLAATLLARKVDPLALFGILGSVYFLIWTVWEHHYMMYLPVLVLLVMFRPRFRWVALAVFTLVALPTPYWMLNHVWNTQPLAEDNPLFMLQSAWPAWGVMLYHAIKPVPIMMLWGYLVYDQLRGGVDLAWVNTSAASLRRLGASQPHNEELPRSASRRGEPRLL